MTNQYYFDKNDYLVQVNENEICECDSIRGTNSKCELCRMHAESVGVGEN